MPLSNNISDLTAEVARLLRDKGITAIDESDYIDFLNNAQDFMSEQIRIFHKVTDDSTVSGQQEYDVPADYMAIYAEDSVTYTDEDSNDNTVSQVVYEQVRGYDDLFTASGTPTVFWLKGDIMYLYPTPDYSGTDNLSIEHYNYAPSLGGGTSAKTDIKYVYETYTILTTDTIVFGNGTFTITLPSAVTNGSMEITMKNVGTGTLTISPQSGQVIDGAALYYLSTQYETVTLKSDASNWYIIRKV